MKKQKGFTLVEIMIVVAIIALLAAIAIPNLLRARATANESVAQATLRTISTALETYAVSHSGSYNVAVSDLADKTKYDPVYLNENYADGTARNGYKISCEAPAEAAYSCTATPANCRVSGIKIFTIKTGGVISFVDCT